MAPVEGAGGFNAPQGGGGGGDSGGRGGPQGGSRGGRGGGQSWQGGNAPRNRPSGPNRGDRNDSPASAAVQSPTEGGGSDTSAKS